MVPVLIPGLGMMMSIVTIRLQKQVCTNITQNFQVWLFVVLKMMVIVNLEPKKACVDPHFHVITSFGPIFYDPFADPLKNSIFITFSD